MRTAHSAPRRLQTARDLVFVRCPRRVRRALRWHLLGGHGVPLSQLALLAAAVLSSAQSWANPKGEQVVAGQVNVLSSVPGTLNIHQGSTKAIIHWKSFNIANGETVNFLQPTADSLTLNRVLGNDPSEIYGRLNANGQVLLINPNGVVFGPTARVDVGGLVATTANIRDDDFLAGRYLFSEASARSGARIVNGGEISIRDSGLAALVAPSVHNSGVIQAKLGRVVLAGASTFTLDFQGDGLLSFAAGAAVDAQVINTGTLTADGGTVLLSAHAVKGVVDQVINTDGIISASTVGGTPGRIVLDGGDSGTVAVSGALQASGSHGGRVIVNGERVQVADGARIDVSGVTGGGEIALGSDGYATTYGRKSWRTTVAGGARLNADALTLGDGGHITLWSKDTTIFAGSLSARGGTEGGRGGFAEVSSLKNIGLTGQVDLRAPRGASGTLLLDPTDLRITDSASGGSQDGNATDGTVAAGDANQGSGATLNTVSRGLLESLSGSASIVLQATGQVTVDAMAGGLLNLATTAGHGFTLQSTQSGGIRFVDAATEIRTQGGDITLEALGVGSTLTNIGTLSSNGGAITLKATGDIEVAGIANAATGALSVQSTGGAITNALLGSPILRGASVSLLAPGGQVGGLTSAIRTQTSNLTVVTGKDAVVASDAALGTLNITANHVSPSSSYAYFIGAPGLDFQAIDGTALRVNRVEQSGLNFSLTSDRSIDVGSISLGAGSLLLKSSAGDLQGRVDTALTAGSGTLIALGSNGNNGAIGSVSQPLLSTLNRLDATAGSGGVYLTNAAALALDRLLTTGSANLTAAGTVTVGDVSAGSATLTLGSTGGSVLDDGNASTRVTANTLNLAAAGAIGSSITPLSTNASTISANAALGGIYASTSATSSVLSSITSGNGAIDIRTGGSTTLTSLTSSTTSASNDITVTATGTGSLSVGTVNAGALGDVSLTTTSGSISGSSGLITGNTVTLNAANSGAVSVRTAASHLDVLAGSSSINITQSGSVTLDRISTPSTLVSVTSSSGDITVGSVSTAASGQVNLTASAGAILDDGNTTTRVSTGTASLSASGAIGSSSHAVQTKATGLAATSTGDLFVTNTDTPLTSLSITNRHSAPGVAGTLQMTSPYLTFDVIDSGTSYTLNRLVSVPLGSLSFSGDATLQLGQVQAAGSVNLTATQGNIVDDGNLQSRATAGSTLTLSAAQGSVGSSSNAIGVNASSLALTTRGDLYVSSLTDLSTLTLTSSHPDTTTSFGMAITAPSLKLSVSDSASGHAVQTLTDNSSLSLTFTSDRDITLGQVDVTHTGTARFTSTGGVIKDDGDKNTRLLANSTTLSGQAVGAVGAAYMDVVTGTLAATASAGGVYIQVPMPTGSTNTTSTVTLGTITAAGPVAITALEGDLSLGGFMTATNQSVNLTATQGSILSPSGYSIAIGTGSLTMNADRAIGTSGNALPVTSSTGATLTAQAGTSMFASSSGPMTLFSLDAGTSISYTQSSGAITVGHVDATAGGTVAITATTGAIQNDSDAATGIRADQVTLSAAQSSIGSGTALAVNTPKLLLTANGAVAVTNSATMDTLSITRGSGSSGSMDISGVSGQSFTFTEDSTEHYVEAVDSSTPLAFSFSGQRGVKIGRVDVGTTGSVSLSSAASLTNDGLPGSRIAAGTVSLTAGTAGSIGATGSGNAISLEGTTILTLGTGRNAFVDSDTALTDLAITSTNTTTAVGTASVFGVSGLSQTFGITDSGTTQSLNYTGTALANTSFTTRKNIVVSAISATGDVTLATSGGGANSNISSDSGSGRIAGNRVLLTAASTTAGGGSIGSSGTALRVDTPTLILTGSGNVYVNDAQNLARLDMTLSHGTNTTFGYGVTAGNLSSFTITDGSTQSLGLAVSGAMDFSYSVDRALSLATLDAGTSTTGSLSLTSRSAPTGTNAQINRSSGSLTGGTITLSATGPNGGVGAGATLSTNTKNLRIATGGNVSISNSTSLTSLSLDARHNTSGSSTHSYSVSSTGLTFSISDTLGSNAFQLSNITQTSLDLTVKADRVITASSVNTGAGGKVTLQSSSYVQGGSGASAGSPSITTGDLTLNGGSAFGYQGSTPLYTAAGTLSSSLSNTLYLSNAGALTLKTNTVGSSADVASSNNSLLQGSGGLFTTPTLKLSANQSLGSTGSLLTDVRRLTVVARKDIDVTNASDLYALTMTSTHATAGVQNTISVAAPRLALALTDSLSGDQYHLSNLVDSTGLDFTLSTDVALNLGTVNAQAGRALALYSTGSATSITNDGGSLLTGGSILLSADGSLGAAGGTGTRMQTNALSLTLATGANAYADNAQDLTSLSLTSSQAPGGTAPLYQVTAPSLSFDITDDGTTRINNVTDSTGLNFVLNTRRDQLVSTIDVGRSGTVSLTGTGDILGDADSSKRIGAASVTLYASNGGAIGSVGNPIRLSAPLTSFAPTGALNVESDTHIDSLSISVTHPTVSYGGTYSIVSVPISGAAYPLFTATDSVTGTALTSLNDPLGLTFSFTSDAAMQVGTLNLGTTGRVVLTGTGSGSILGDGDPSTLVQAASLSLTSYGGAVGATGSGNGIDAKVNTISATAQGGGVSLALQGPTTLGTISSTGGVGLTNADGDIALGVIDVGGNAIVINNLGGSILSGSIANTTTVSLTASGSIGSTSAIGISANGGGTTTLTAAASAAHGASGSIDISESYNLFASSVTAPAGVTLSSGYDMSVGTVTSGGAVALSASQGSINGINSSNAITGASVNLSASYGTGNGLGSSLVRLNVNTPQLVLNTPGSVYVTDSADLNLLTVDRTNFTGAGSSGTLSIIASGLTFSATDSSDTTTLTSLADGTGLDFSYLGIGSLSVGSLNVGAGSVLLQAYLSSGDGNINATSGSSLITAGNLTMLAYGTDSNIGSSGTPLGLAVGSLTASSGSGGMVLQQTGSLNLSNLVTTGGLNVTASSGDLTLGSFSWGSASALNISASGGSILAGGATLTGGSAGAAVTLNAANGIGTAAAPIKINASSGHAVNMNVTGVGSLYLNSVGTLNGGLTSAVNDGATVVSAAGSIKLTAVSSGTDASGNDIRVTANAGDITVQSVSGGPSAKNTVVSLAANGGRLLVDPGATLEGFDVQLHGAAGVGDATNRVAARGELLRISSNAAAIYLNATTPTVMSAVDSKGGAIDITHSADLVLANATSGGGNITVNGSAAGANLIVGNVNAVGGTVALATTGVGAKLIDDGNRNTAIAGGTVNLTGAGGVGSASQSLQTYAGALNVSSGNGIYINDGSPSVVLNSLIATTGGINVGSDGSMTVVDVRANSGVDWVSLSATTGSIVSGGAGSSITSQGAVLNAGGDIGLGAPLRVNLSSGALTLTSGGSAAVVTAGNLDLSTGLNVLFGDLSLAADGLLTLPVAGINTLGGVTLRGGTDVRSNGVGAAARQIAVNGSSLVLTSGSAGGDTSLLTQVDNLQASLTGVGKLTVNNTGALVTTALTTADGDISATSSSSLSADGVVAGGTGRSISLVSALGDVTVGRLDAGSTGSISLSAAVGSLSTVSADLTARSLDLVSGSGIGSSTAAFSTSVQQVSAEVTGSGSGIFLSSPTALTVTRLVTNGGDIDVSATGGINLGGVSTTGAQRYTGDLTLSGDITGRSILISGGLNLAGSARTLTGDLRIIGALNGNGFGATFLGGSGDVVLGGPATALASLNASGANIGVGSVATNGDQRYQGTTTLNGTYGTQGGAFNVVGATRAAGTTQINADGGAVSFGGALDGGQAVTINSSGATRLDGTVTLASLITDAPGTLVINGGTVTTTGAQRYGERLVLGNDLLLSGSSVLLSQGADAALPGEQSLALVGDVVLSAAVGRGAALRSLTVTGDTVLNGGAVNTTGAQSYGGSLTLGADTALSGNGLSFSGPIGGAVALTVAGGSGKISFGGAIGDGTALTSLTTSGSDILTLGGNVSTTGLQSYSQRLVLAADTVLTGSALNLLNGADAASAGAASLTLAGSAFLGNSLGATQALRSMTALGSTVLGAGVVNTTAAQRYGRALTLNGNQVLSGSGIAFDGTVDGAHDLTVNVGSSNASFGVAVGSNTRLGALTINSSGATTVSGAVQAASVSTDTPGTLTINGGSVNTSGAQSYGERLVMGASTNLVGTTVALRQGAQAPALNITGNTLLGGDVTTTGAQRYGGALDLIGDAVLAGDGVTVVGNVNGAQALTVVAGNGDARLESAMGNTTRLGAMVVQSSGATVFGGAVQAASLSTDAPGTLALQGGSVNTTGAQSYGERAVLSADTTLTGSRVSLLAGADASVAGAQGLTVVGEAALGGAIGGRQALRQLSVSGPATLAAGTVSTTGDQRFDGAVQLLGDQQLRSATGGLTFANRLDSTGRTNVSLIGDAGAVALNGAVGEVGALGALTVRAGTTADYGGNVRANSLQQTVGGLSRFLGTVSVDGVGGIDVRSANVRFDGSVTATAGALNIALADPNGTLRFAPEANIKTASGFSQSGGSAVLLPATIDVTLGPITLSAPATLPQGEASIKTQGDISLVGLSGPATSLTLDAGNGDAPAGRLLIGRDDGDPTHVLDVARLRVSDAASAQLFGRISGKGGALAASLVRSSLFNAPYFINSTPWGPPEIINQLVATTVPTNVVPSTSTLAPLFLRQASWTSVTPNAVEAFSAPPVLRLQGQGVNTTGSR